MDFNGFLFLTSFLAGVIPNAKKRKRPCTHKLHACKDEENGWISIWCSKCGLLQEIRDTRVSGISSGSVANFKMDLIVSGKLPESQMQAIAARDAMVRNDPRIWKARRKAIYEAKQRVNGTYTSKKGRLQRQSEETKNKLEAEPVSKANAVADAIIERPYQLKRKQSTGEPPKKRIRRIILTKQEKEAAKRRESKGLPPSIKKKKDAKQSTYYTFGALTITKERKDASNAAENFILREGERREVISVQQSRMHLTTYVHADPLSLPTHASSSSSSSNDNSSLPLNTVINNDQAVASSPPQRTALELLQELNGATSVNLPPLQLPRSPLDGTIDVGMALEQCTPMQMSVYSPVSVIFF